MDSSEAIKQLILRYIFKNLQFIFTFIKDLVNQAVEICYSAGEPIKSVIVLEHIKRVKIPRGAKIPEVS